VIVTILENGEEAALAEVGDYLDRLTDFEERLARGEGVASDPRNSTGTGVLG
jgi:hypothetical protein